MNLEDESYLSAYLDDELDPADRASVAWAIESDPQVRERYQALCRTREILAGVSTPCLAIDLSSTVLAQLPNAQRSFPSGRTLYRGSLWVATAASVLFAVYVSRPHDPNLNPKPKTVPGSALARPDQLVQGPASPVPQVAKLVSTEPSALIPDASQPKARPTEQATADRGPVKTPLESKSEGERDRLLALLDRPDLRRVVIPMDVYGADAADRINTIVRDSARKDPDYARFTLAQGLVIDPSLPNGAELFVLVVDENERRHILSSLERDFPDVTEEKLSDTEVPSLLADVGKISILPGQKAAGLIDAPAPFDSVASKQAPPFHHVNTVEIGRHGPSSLPLFPENLTSELAPKGGVNTVLKTPGTARERSARTDGKVTLLVWVTRRGSPD